MLKDFVRTAARLAGFELHRYVPVRANAAQLAAILGHHDVNLILDVGANTGQFARELRRHIGYRGRIVSFEPTAAAHAALVHNAASDALWEVAERAAIGASDGFIEINVAANSVSSSALPMLASHVSAAPGSVYTAVERVPLRTLDSLADRYFTPGSIGFLKIDTQGFESEVLKGARTTLARIAGLQLELSIVPLYEGQLLMTELMAQIHALGFDTWAIYPAFTDSNNGRLLQVDATFFRSGAAVTSHV